MKIVRQLLSFFFVTSIVITNLQGCNSAKKSHFSYKLNTYSVENGENYELPIKSHLISYYPYVFEFRLNFRQEDSVLLKSGRTFRRIWYDTNSVYLLNTITKRFVEFDTFKRDAKIIKSGRFSEKEFGIKLSDTLPKVLSFIKENNFRDTVLSDTKLYYIDTLQKNQKGEDSILNYFFFYRNPTFISMYEYNIGLSPNPDFSIVGYSSFFYKQRQGIFGILENLRRLTRYEEKICSSMINQLNSK